MFLSVAPATVLNLGMRYVPDVGMKIVENKLFPTLIVLVALCPGTIEWMRRNVQMQNRLEREMSGISKGGLGIGDKEEDGLGKVVEKEKELGMEPPNSAILHSMRVEEDLETGTVALSLAEGNDRDMTSCANEVDVSDAQIQQRTDDAENRNLPTSTSPDPVRALAASSTNPSQQPSHSTNSSPRPSHAGTRLLTVPAPLTIPPPSSSASSSLARPPSPSHIYPFNSNPRNPTISISTDHISSDRRSSTDGTSLPRGRPSSVLSRRTTALSTNPSLQRDTKDHRSIPRPISLIQTPNPQQSTTQATKIAETVACYTDDDDVARLRNQVLGDGRRGSSANDSYRERRKKTRAAESSNLTVGPSLLGGGGSIGSMSVVMSRGFSSRAEDMGSAAGGIGPRTNNSGLDILPPPNPNTTSNSNSQPKLDTPSLNREQPTLPTQPTSLLTPEDCHDQTEEVIMNPALSKNAPYHISRWTLSGRDIVPMPLRQMQWIVACVCIAAMTFFIGQVGGCVFCVFWGVCVGVCVDNMRKLNGGRKFDDFNVRWRGFTFPCAHGNIQSHDKTIISHSSIKPIC